jgi:hypothetical protein
MASSTIKYKMLRNVTVDIAEGKTTHIPMRQVSAMTADGFEVSRVSYDMNFEHVLSLPSGLSYREPKIPAGAPERLADALRENAIARWIKARADAEPLRRRLQHLIDSGTIAIVDDPTGFLDDDLVDNEVEVANAILNEQADAPAKQRGAK